MHTFWPVFISESREFSETWRQMAWGRAGDERVQSMRVFGGKRNPDHTACAFSEEVDLFDFELIQHVDDFRQHRLQRPVVGIPTRCGREAVSTEIANDEPIFSSDSRYPGVPEIRVPSVSMLDEEDIRLGPPWICKAIIIVVRLLSEGYEFRHTELRLGNSGNWPP